MVDFAGQVWIDFLYQFILISFAIIAFLVGFALKDIVLMMKIFGVGCCFTLLVRTQELIFAL